MTRKLNHPDPDVWYRAALDWCRWEDFVSIWARVAAAARYCRPRLPNIG